jgi:hypothetical protein
MRSQEQAAHNSGTEHDHTCMLTGENLWKHERAVVYGVVLSVGAKGRFFIAFIAQPAASSADRKEKPARAQKSPHVLTRHAGHF